MILYEIFIKERFKEKLNHYYADVYIERDNLYAHTDDKKLLNRFMKERNPDAFSIRERICSDDEYYSIYNNNPNIALEVKEILYDVNKKLKLIMMAYEIDYIHERYCEHILYELAYDFSEFNYHMLKYKYRYHLDSVLMTYFIESSNPDDNIREINMENFECGILPNSYRGYMDFHPNELAILCKEFQILFDKRKDK